MAMEIAHNQMEDKPQWLLTNIDITPFQTFGVANVIYYNDYPQLVNKTERENSPIFYQTSDISTEDTSSLSKQDDKISSEEEFINYGIPYYLSSYAFELPSSLVGKMIGKSGRVIKRLKLETNSQIYVTLHPYKQNYNVVVIEGSEYDISVAIQKIREIYPKHMFPYITLANIDEEMIQQSQFSLYYLVFPQHAFVHAQISSVISAGHIFLQQIDNPLYLQFLAMQQNMNIYYNVQNLSNIATPLRENNLIPTPILNGTLCATKMIGSDNTLTCWFRAQVLEYVEDADDCLVKLLDYGGVKRIPRNELRQLRMDFLTLPVMATECYLSNVIPIEGESVFSLEACKTMEKFSTLPFDLELQAEIFESNENPDLVDKTNYTENLTPELDLVQQNITEPLQALDDANNVMTDTLKNVVSLYAKVDAYAVCNGLPFVTLYACKATTLVENSSLVCSLNIYCEQRSPTLLQKFAGNKAQDYSIGEDMVKIQNDDDLAHAIGDLKLNLEFGDENTSSNLALPLITPNQMSQNMVSLNNILVQKGLVQWTDDVIF